MVCPLLLCDGWNFEGPEFINNPVRNELIDLVTAWWYWNLYRFSSFHRIQKNTQWKYKNIIDDEEENVLWWPYKFLESLQFYFKKRQKLKKYSLMRRYDMTITCTTRKTTANCKDNACVRLRYPPLASADL